MFLLLTDSSRRKVLRSNARLHRTETSSRRSQAMTARELRQKAMYYRRVARSVSDDVLAEAMLKLAAEYDSLADKMKAEPTPGAAQQ